MSFTALATKRSDEAMDMAQNSLNCTTLALKSSEEAGDKGEAAWAVELCRTYDGSSKEGKESKAKALGGALGNRSFDVYTFQWGKEYVAFSEFTMRGADLQHAAAAGAKPIQKSKRQDELGTTRQEIDFGIDWQSMGSI